MEAQFRRSIEGFAILAPLAVFFVFYLSVLPLICISGDDAQTAQAAWDILAQFHTHQWSLPLMRCPIHGAGSIYLYLPFVLIFGRTVAAVHWHNAFFSAATIIATHRLGLMVSRDKWTAFLAAVLLAASPTFVLYSVKATPANVAEAGLGAACLCLLLAYSERRKPWLAYSGFLCLGVGVAGRTCMAAYAAGLAVFLAVFFLRGGDELLPIRAPERRRFLFGCAASFAICVAPLLLFPFLHKQEFISAWIERLDVRQEMGSNADYLHNLLTRLAQVRMLLNGTSMLRIFTLRFRSYAIGGEWFLAPGLIFAASRMRSSRWALPCTIAIVYLLLSPLSPSRMRDLHLTPLLPLIYLMACSWIGAVSGRRRSLVIAAFVFFGAYRVCSAGVFFRKFRAEVAQTGGNDPVMSPVTLDMVNWFSARPDPHVVFFDTYSHAIFEYLFRGDAHVVHLESPFPQFVVGPTKDAREIWDEAFADPSNYYVWEYNKDMRNTLEWEFQRQAARRGRRGVLIDQIKFPNGDPAYAIYQAAPLLSLQRRGK